MSTKRGNKKEDRKIKVKIVNFYYSNEHGRPMPRVELFNISVPQHEENTIATHIATATPNQAPEFWTLMHKIFQFATASLLMVMLMIFLFITTGKSEEDVQVSWEKVILGKEYSRLLYAHLYNFSPWKIGPRLFNYVCIGKYIDRKFNCLFGILVLELMGIATNSIYLLLSNWFEYPEYVGLHGLTGLMYGLRVFVAFAQEPQNYEPGLFLGLYPAFMSTSFAPWLPALEIFILKLQIQEMNVCGHVSGFLSGFLFAFLILVVPKMIPRR